MSAGGGDGFDTAGGVVLLAGGVVVDVGGTDNDGAVLVLEDSCGLGFFFFGSWSAGSLEPVSTAALTVASPTSITSAGSRPVAAALDSPPPPAPAMPNAAAKATITTPATMRSCRGFILSPPSRARGALSTNSLG